MKVLHAGASPATLATVRCGVFGLWLVKIATDSWESLAALPADFFDRVGVLRLIPAAAWRALHTAGFLAGARALTVVCLALSALGRWRTPAALASCLLLTFHEGLVRGVGYVNHAELPLLYAAFILAASPLIDRAAGQKRSDVPLVLIVTVLCLTYTLTAVSRLALWTPWVLHPSNMTMWILTHAHATTYDGFEIGRRVLELPAIVRSSFSVGLLLVTLIELLAVVVLVSRRFRRVFLAVMIPFHVVTFVTMNILFWENLALYALLFDIDPWLGYWTSRRRIDP